MRRSLAGARSASGSVALQIKAIGCGGAAAATDSNNRYFRSAEGYGGASRTKMNLTPPFDSAADTEYAS